MNETNSAFVKRVIEFGNQAKLVGDANSATLAFVGLLAKLLDFGLPEGVAFEHEVLNEDNSKEDLMIIASGGERLSLPRRLIDGGIFEQFLKLATRVEPREHTLIGDWSEDLSDELSRFGLIIPRGSWLAAGIWRGTHPDWQTADEFRKMMDCPRKFARGVIDLGNQAKSVGNHRCATLAFVGLLAKLLNSGLPEGVAFEHEVPNANEPGEDLMVITADGERLSLKRCLIDGTVFERFQKLAIPVETREQTLEREKYEDLSHLLSLFCLAIPDGWLGVRVWTGQHPHWLTRAEAEKNFSSDVDHPEAVNLIASWMTTQPDEGPSGPPTGTE